MVDIEHDRIDLGRLNCGDQSHSHVGQVEAFELVEKGAAEWIREPANSKDKGIVRILRENGAIRGLSAKVGATLAIALEEDKEIKKEREPWAVLMLADIYRRKLPPDAESPAYVPPMARPGQNAPAVAVTA